MGLQTLGLTTELKVEIISAYASSMVPLSSVTATPGWFVVGAFSMPVDSDAALEAIGSVAAAGAHLHVRLYDVTAAAVITGSIIDITGLVSTRGVSGVFSLDGGHLYQIQAEVIFGTSTFGVVYEASLLPSS